MSVGKKFADISMVRTEDGKKKKLSKIAGKGKPVVVIVYASSIPECRTAVNMAEESATTQKHIDFVLLNVEDDAATAESFLKELGVRACESFTGKLPKGYDVREGALPYHIVIDESGKVLHASEDTTSDYLQLVA